VDPRLLLPADFELGAPSLAHAPPDSGREVAFAGRSNAGKSSVLNRLTGQRALARTSRTPGRTQHLNFFRVDDAARLVDLPGYGYARADLETRDAWQVHVEAYLSARQALVGVVLVMDVRHPFQPFDEQLIAWAGSSAIPLLVLLNKADKLGHGARADTLRSATERLRDTPTAEAILFSALRGMGAETALRRVRQWLCLPETPDGAASSGPQLVTGQDPDA
jgi:GTP-binding protein